MRIEIVSRRASDSDTAFAVFVDGVEVQPEITDIDPGAGHFLSEWRTHITESAAAATPAAAAVIRCWGEQAEGAAYITDDPRAVAS